MKNMFPVLLVLLMSCAEQKKPTEKVVPENPEISQAKDMEGCYQSIFGKDTSLLKIKSLTGDSASGTLSFHWFQKDRNDGLFSAAITDSSLVGYYNFMSEGKSSVRQIAFKITSDTLIEGYGEIEMRNDTSFFKKVSDLKYISQRPLIKIRCE